MIVSSGAIHISPPDVHFAGTILPFDQRFSLLFSPLEPCSSWDRVANWHRLSPNDYMSCSWNKKPYSAYKSACVYDVAFRAKLPVKMQFVDKRCLAATVCILCVLIKKMHIVFIKEACNFSAK